MGYDILLLLELHELFKTTLGLAGKCIAHSVALLYWYSLYVEDLSTFSPLLISKTLHIYHNCVVCGDDIEITDHLFFFCSY